MKRNTIQFTLFIMMILALAVSSCKDDTDGNGDGGDGGGDPTGMDDDYLPRSAGNTWDYSDDSRVETTNENSDGSFNITNFGPISGISLSIAEDLTVNTITIAKDEGNYNIEATLDVIQIPGYDGLASPIRYTILKDDAAVGTTWTSELLYVYSYTPNLPLLPQINTPPISIPYTFEIMEKDMTLEVGAKTFDNVIHVNQRFENLLGGLVSTDIFYAEGVGVIRYQTTDGVTSSTDLVAYDLN